MSSTAMATNMAETNAQQLSIVDEATATTTTSCDPVAGASPLSSATDDHSIGTGGEGSAVNDSAAQQPNHIIHVYNPRKPKWWNRLGNNGRDATKSQKRAVRNILDGAAGDAAGEHRGLRLPPVPYGSQLDWDEVFPNSVQQRDIWLELGFGRGENLQALLDSRQRREGSTHGVSSDGGPNTGDELDGHTMPNLRPFHLVGAEVSGVGIGCLCKRIEQLQQEEQEESNGNDRDPGYVFYRSEMDPYASSEGEGNASPDPVRNKATVGGDIPSRGEPNDPGAPRRWPFYRDRLRIHAGDGYKLLPKIPDGSLAAILVTFPDPFPKDTDVHYRLVQHQTLLECHRILRKADAATLGDIGGRLFLATDHDGYHAWCHATMQEANAQNSRQQPLFALQEPCPDRSEWLPAVSRYEQKGWDEGRSTKLSCWRAL